ncbi:MAG: methionyl-tRNA formyltransferase [Betaproteobacteria bacterium]
MKIIFAGTPPFAAAALAALHAAGHKIALVLTQPDRAAGRGLKLKPSAVAEQAARLALEISKPLSLKADDVQMVLRALAPDVMVVAAYGLLLPQAVLDIPKYGCINIHGSLLPRWRGAAPVQRAIEAGDTETGIAIMQMDAGLDTGPVLLSRACPIAPEETSETLFEKLTVIASKTIVEALQELLTLRPQQQHEEAATYARKIDKSEGRVDWTTSAAALERRIRAFDPSPGCETVHEGDRLKIWHAQCIATRTGFAPGTIVEVAPDRLVVQCGDGALSLVTVQRSGGKRMKIAEFLRGSIIQRGWRFV